MNTKKSIIQVLTLVVMLFAFVLAPPPAKAQVTATSFQDMLYGPTNVAGSSTLTVLTARVIDLPQGKGFAFIPASYGTNASTAAQTYTFALSYDGTNWSTLGPTYVCSMNGTTVVRGYTNFPPTVIGNVPKIKLLTIQNAHTASLFVSNSVLSVSN